MQTAGPKVSVIIPAYNVARFIGATLESVWAQTFTDFEVIVVNDGSPDADDLERAIEPYRTRLNYITQENRGASAARNAGVNAARGEVIAFLDADDLWLPNYLEQQLKFLCTHEIDLVCADAVVFNDFAEDEQTYFQALLSGHDEIGNVTFAGLISGEQSLITSGVVARRQSLIEAGLFDVGLRNAQDFDLWIRMALRGARMGYQRKVLVRYRHREGSLSGDAVNRVNRELRVYQKILQQYDLTPAQSAEVEQAILRLGRELNLVLGKEHLNRREFAAALACFRKAQSVQSNWKLRVTCALLSRAPNVFTKLNSSLNAWRGKRPRAILRNTP